MLPNKWFTNRGQVIQTTGTTIGAAFGGYKAWPDMVANQYLSGGAILFYLLVGLMVGAVGLLIAAKRSQTPDELMAEIADLRSKLDEQTRASMMRDAIIDVRDRTIAKLERREPGGET